MAMVTARDSSSPPIPTAAQGQLTSLDLPRPPRLSCRSCFEAMAIIDGEYATFPELECWSTIAGGASSPEVIGVSAQPMLQPTSSGERL